MRRLAPGFVVFWVTFAACAQAPTEYLDIATTETVNNSGILAELLPRVNGLAYRVHATDSAHAIAMLYDEVVDLVITSDAEAEARALREQPTWTYRKLAYNRLVMVGPKDDPAHVREASDLADAFRRIATTPVSYVARDDGSDIRRVEQRWWRYATFGVTPLRGRMITRTGIAAALNVAADRQGYALSDPATFWRLEKQLDLAVLFERDLLNSYAAIHSRFNDKAARLGEWLAGEDARRRVAGYRVEGRTVFTVWPDGCPGEHASDQLCRPGPAGKPIKDEMVFVDGIGPPGTLREMRVGADAVIVARYTGTSHEFAQPSGGTKASTLLPRFERLGLFEILEVLKPHSALPASGRMEVVVPGSYQEFPRYILHTYADDVDEPLAGRTYVIFLQYLGTNEVAWRSKWSQWSFYDVSGDSPKSLAAHSRESGRTTKAFLQDLRAH